MGGCIKPLAIKALASVVLGIIIQSVFPWTIFFLIPGIFVFACMAIWKRESVFAILVIVSALNAAIQQPVRHIPRTRDMLFKGLVVLEDQRESGTRLLMNLQHVICSSDTIALFMPVDFYTYEKRTFLGRTLSVKGRLDDPVSQHRFNVLVGKIIGDETGQGMTGVVFSPVSRYIDNMLKRYLSKTNYDLSSSLILGGSSRVGKELQDVFTRSGVLHILSVSGLHVGFVFSFVGLLLLFLPISPKIKFVLIMSILFIYAGITGFRPSVVRAGLMAFLFGLALVMQRHVDSMHVLNITALCVLVVSPSMLFDLGTQLSFISVYGILFLYPRIDSLILGRLKNRVLKMTAALMAVSFSAQLFVSPLIINYFHRVQTMALFSNLIIVPLTSLITYLLFFSMMLGTVFSSGLGMIFGLISLMLKALVAVSTFFSAIPFSSLSVSLSSLMSVMFYFLFVRRLRRIAVLAILVTLLAITLSELRQYTTVIRSEEATLIEMPGGETILISRRNGPADAFTFNVSSVSYLVAGRDMFQHTKDFITTPKSLHYKKLRFSNMVVDIGPRNQVSFDQCVVDLDARKPNEGRLLYMLTNGRKICEFEKPVYCTLVEQLIAEMKLIIARYRLLLSI